MKERIFMCILVLFYVAKQSNEIESANITSLKPTSNKNTTNAVVEQELITTTKRPFLQGIRLPCSCGEGECGCCTGPILDTFNQKACLNITYEPDEFAFTAALKLNGRVVYRNSISDNTQNICKQYTVSKEVISNSIYKLRSFTSALLLSCSVKIDFLSEVFEHLNNKA